MHMHDKIHAHAKVNTSNVHTQHMYAGFMNVALYFYKNHSYHTFHVNSHLHALVWDVSRV